MSKQRKKKGKQLNYSIYIVCEGTNTEPIYFKAIAEDVVKEYRVTVYPSEDQIKASKKEGESIKTDAVNLVKIAKREREINNYDEVWAVFDKDGYTKHKEAFLYAKKHGVNLAFSSIAILNDYTRYQALPGSAYPEALPPLSQPRQSLWTSVPRQSLGTS